MIDELILRSFKEINHFLEEGVHIIDQNGRTVLYNAAMEKIEGLRAVDVMGKHLLDVFPNLKPENSTLLAALKTGKQITLHKQSYLNLEGKKITTVNNTFPLIDENKIVGAVEVAMNYSNVSALSEKIVELQQKLIQPKLCKDEKKDYSFDKIIGNDKNFMRMVKIAKRASMTSSSVLIQGDTGTGKEVFAQSIHYESARYDKPFIAQNCSAIPESLLESILFGTVKGSFTGAVDRPGIFEQANNGTLFLDEINSMSMQLQAKLLRVLQESYVRRIGGSDDIHVDVRIIAATNQDPKRMINENGLRNDLYYRLNVINIKLPSLSERKGDIALLTDHFIHMYNKLLDKEVWGISDELNEIFQNYTWNGNVRELQNIIESAMNMVSKEHIIGMEHLPFHIEGMLTKKSVEVEKKLDFDSDSGLNQCIGSIEKKIIKNALERNEYNISRSAKELKITRQNLQYKIKKHSICT